MPNDYIRRDKSLLAYLSAEAYAQLQRVPAADVVEVRHGRWIQDDETGVPVCSECHSGKPTQCVCSSVIQHNLKNYEIRYCYYCGAKMDGGVNDGKTD